MEKNNKAEELIKSLKSIEPLEEVPPEVSQRFNETLAKLASRDVQTSKRGNWLTGTNQFALAASFTLVFALGAVLTLNSGGDSSELGADLGNQPSVSSPESNIGDDQLLYSGSENSIPKTSPESILITNSGHDYADIPTSFPKALGVGGTWNSLEALDPALVICIKSLDLTAATNSVDSGVLNGKAIRAIWSPLTSTTWNVYIADTACNVIDKKYVSE